MSTTRPFSVARSRQSARTVGRQYQSWVLMGLISLTLFGGIGTRLAYLQLIQGPGNRERAENNRIRIVPKQPIRGNIFDRHGNVIATTRLSHSLYLWPKVQKQENWPQILAHLSEILGMSTADIQARMEQEGYDSPTLIRIARNLDPAQITAIEEYRYLLDGVEVDVETVRDYPHRELAAHVLGYTGELSPEALEKRKVEGYRIGDIVGQMGVEAAFEKQLRGEWGGIQLEVDGAGRVLRILGQKKARSGQDVHLTLDLAVQKAAELALGDRKGAIVALDPTDGSVLAMASQPTFDPNVFSARITPEVWEQLQTQGNPFVNRAMRGFPPASTFKVVTATAGMESGRYPPHTVLGTFAYLNVGGTLFGEWNRAGFGPMGYVQALAWSSNTFHGQVGRGVGGPTLIKWARNFGFGSATGIELGAEAKGLIADAAWKRQQLNWDWSDGDTVNMSIGQGFTLATPLQVAVMFAVPANGGTRVQPHLLKHAPNLNTPSLNLKPETLQTLRAGLRAVVTHGTGKALNVPGLPPAAGKSGTAEAPPGDAHAWFGGYAPHDQPEIVVVAFAEHSGGGGGSVAGPMVQQVMAAYFQSNQSSPPSP